MKKGFLTRWNWSEARELNDKDYKLDPKPCEMLDTCKHPTVEQQVRMFVEAGRRLDETKRALFNDLDEVGDDTDIDEYETPLDDPYCDNIDVFNSMRSFSDKIKKRQQAKKEVGEAGKVDNLKKEADEAGKVDKDK